MLEKFSPTIDTLTLIPSSGGRFEVIVGDDLIYSKKTTNRHANPGEIAQLYEQKTGLSPAT